MLRKPRRPVARQGAVVVLVSMYLRSSGEGRWSSVRRRLRAGSQNRYNRVLFLGCRWTGGLRFPSTEASRSIRISSSVGS